MIGCVFLWLVGWFGWRFQCRLFFSAQLFSHSLRGGRRACLVCHLFADRPCRSDTNTGDSTRSTCTENKTAPLSHSERACALTLVVAVSLWKGGWLEGEREGMRLRWPQASEQANEQTNERANERAATAIHYRTSNSILTFLLLLISFQIHSNSIVKTVLCFYSSFLIGNAKPIVGLKPT